MACWVVRCLALVVIIVTVSVIADGMALSSRCGVVLAALLGAEVMCALCTRGGLVARFAKARS